VRLVLVLVLVLVLGRWAIANDELKVQTDWHIVGVAVATSSSRALRSSEVRRALDRAGDTIEEELPGVRWHVARDVRSARYDDADGRPEIDGAGLEHLVARLAEKDDELAKADVVYVFAPLPDSSYSGMADLRAAPRGKAPVWYSVVNTRQGGRFAKAASKQLGTDALAEPLRRVVDDTPVRALALHATAVHEFGHFLAPGTKDVRAAKDLAGRLGNGEDEPEKHDLRCIMFTPRDVRSVWAKVRAFPHILQFCDRCRERLGCPLN
jgi:hypothetical protein